VPGGRRLGPEQARPFTTGRSVWVREGERVRGCVEALRVRGVTTVTSGVLARFPLLLPVRNSVASYGASAVTRTSDRGTCGRSGPVESNHVEPVTQDLGNQVIEVVGSKETFLPLNVQPVFSF
jgi:hypothetical protein